MILKTLIALALLVFTGSSQEACDTCGPFPYTADTILNDANDIIPWGPYPVGYRSTAVQDSTLPACNEYVTEYGIPFPTPAIANNGIRQTGFDHFFPANFLDSHHASPVDLWNLPAQVFQDEGITLPKANVRLAHGTWPVHIHLAGLLQYSLDNIHRLMKTASWGWYVLSAQALPCDISLTNEQLFFNASAPNNHLIIQGRVNAARLALLALEDESKTRNSFSYNKIDMSTIWATGESDGGTAFQCWINGCGGVYYVPKVTYPTITFFRPFDPSGDAYLPASNYVGFSIPMVSVMSQNSGGTFGQVWRTWAMNVVGPRQVNSNIFTKGTVHEMVWRLMDVRYLILLLKVDTMLMFLLILEVNTAPQVVLITGIIPIKPYMASVHREH